MKLGVNIDHVATLRQARGTHYPDPVVAALLAEHAGCDSIVAHLREDRRHIRERDVFLIKEAIGVPLNLEMSINKGIVALACDLKPQTATLVPERRQELTTEGGLDLSKYFKRVCGVVKKLKSAGIRVSLFIDPVKEQVDLTSDTGADIVEFNTARFVESKTKKAAQRELLALARAIQRAQGKGFLVAAGHGIDYENVLQVRAIKGIQEFNIGHSIISRSVFIGLIAAVEEMISLIQTKQKKK